jgi:hypothetical protein
MEPFKRFVVGPPGAGVAIADNNRSGTKFLCLLIQVGGLVIFTLKGNEIIWLSLNMVEPFLRDVYKDRENES